MRIKLFVLGSILIFILMAICRPIFSAVEPRPLSIDNDSYIAEDTVTLNINIPPDDYAHYDLLISATGNNYTYKGDFNPVMYFYPTEEGIYTIALVEKSTGAIFYSVAFNVLANNRSGRAGVINDSILNPINQDILKNTLPSQTGINYTNLTSFGATNDFGTSRNKYLISTDKKRYALGERVLAFVTFVNQGDISNVSLYHAFNGASRKYMGDLSYIYFMPEGVGTHHLLLKDNNNQVLEDYAFEVLPSPGKRMIRFLNSKGMAEDVEVNVVDEKNGIGSVNIPISKGALKELRLNNLQLVKNNVSLNLSIGVDDVLSDKIKIGQKRVVKAFAVDSGKLNFTNGTATAIAEGRELWKCRNWDFGNQQCLGAWEKIMDLMPGTEYEIKLSPGDPGYAETGVASINTKKPIYYPGETAEIIIVVLDTEGHLVNEADVILTIVSPDNISSILKTNTGEITETSRGIYEASYSNLNSDGNYSLEVRATGNNVNSTMLSYFTVKSYYEFDIIRDTPVSTDPWSGAFRSRISIFPLTDTTGTDLNLTEILPASFAITDPGGADITISDDNLSWQLRWTGLTGNSDVSYSALPPLITPELYSLGPVQISYDVNGSGNANIFAEARPWYIAVDPVNTSADLETGVITSSGTTTNATTGLILPSNNNAIVGSWVNPTNMYAQDNINTTSLTNVSQSYFGFDTQVPASNSTSNTTILGILLRSRCSSNQTSGTRAVMFNISNDNGTTWSTTGYSTGNIGTSLTNRNHGSLANLWGLVWNDTYINNIRIRVISLVAGGRGMRCDAIWVNVNYSQDDYDVNKTLRTYNYSLGAIQHVNRINISINVTGYSNVTSVAKASTPPDLLVRANNGTAWVVMGFLDVSAAGIYTLATTNAAILDAWVNDSYRNISIEAVYFDANYTSHDELNYTDVWIGINYTEAPVVNINLSLDNTYTNDNTSSVSFNFTQPDNPSANCTLYFDDIAYNTSVVQNNTPARLVANPALSDNNYSVYINCTNNSGVIGQSSTIHITVDTTGPTVNPLIPGNNNWTNISQPAFYFNYSDGLSPFASCSLFVGGLMYGTNETVMNNTLSVITANDTIPDGAYVWNVTCVDMAGNGVGSLARTINIDTTAPTVNPLIPGNNNWTNISQPAFYFNYSDGLSPFASCSLFVGGLMYGTNETVINNILTSITANDTILDGSYEWNVTCVDMAGNGFGSFVRIINIDTIAPTVNAAIPGDNNFTNVNQPAFYFNYSDGLSPFASCSLFVGGLMYGTNETVMNNTLTVITANASISDGSYVWNVTCTDLASSLAGNADRNITIDTVKPVISDWKRNGTSFAIQNYICLNASVTDGFVGVQEVLAEVENPTLVVRNLTMLDDGAGCDAIADDDVYSVSYYLEFAGNYTWNNTHARDYAGNRQTNATNLNWNVTTLGTMTVLLVQPASNLKINESEYNYEYQQTCNVSCDAGGSDCQDVVLYAQYRPSSFFNINTTTTDLVNDEDNFSCGDLLSGSAPCTHTFNITSGSESGGNTWPIRCRASSSNIGSAVSSTIDLTINDHPNASFTYPMSSSWLAGVIMINASASTDVDGTITNFWFEYDNNTDFGSPSTICNGASSNCTWDTSAQNQCENNTLACYLRLTVVDNDGLSNSTYITIGFDTQGPTAVLDRPLNFDNITADSFNVNASASDAESGVDTVTFEYRQNSTADWAFACSDKRGPVYDCDWSISSLPDGNTYEVRTWANDSFGNTGSYDTHYNITLDNHAPNITLALPPDNYTDTDGDLVFTYIVADVSNIANCSLIINNIINQTNNTVQRDINQFFYLNGQNDGLQLNWSINCTDLANFTGASETRNLTVSKSSQMLVNISTDASNYTAGEDAVVITKVTDHLGNALEVDVTTDIVMVFNKSEQVSPWWNASWKMRKAIYISSSDSQNRTNITAVVNITGLAGNITSCVNEIRVAPLIGSEVPVNIIAGDDSTYCSIAFKANVSANANNENGYFVYYNNSAATNPSYATFENYQYNITTIDAADSWVNGGAATSNYGTDATVQIRGRAIPRRAYIRFNFTSIPTEVTDVSQATMCLYLSTDGTTNGIAAYHVYDQTWTELGITHNNQPCGTAFNNATNCNLTAEDTQTTTGLGWKCWNVTKMTGAQIANGVKNLSIALKNLTETGTSVSVDALNSKENTNASSIPYLIIVANGRQAPNITGTSIGSTQKWMSSNSSQTNSSGIWTWGASTIGFLLGNYSAVSLGDKTSYASSFNYTFFEVYADYEYPVVKLMSPPNNNITGNGNVTFYYNVSDDGSLANCSLVIDGSKTNTTLSPPKNTQLPLGYELSEGTYNWSVNCTDTTGKENASGMRNITIDMTGPVVTLDRPLQDEIINTFASGLIYTVNATASDSGIGTISTVTFMYRYNSSDTWKFACSDNRSPTWDCEWNLTLLINGHDYEVRAYANDSLGNVGGNDTHINITLYTQPVNITSIVLDDGLSSPINRIDLQAGATSTVYCNITARDPDVYTNILGVNATFYSTTTTFDAADYNKTHYSNSSCTFLTGGGPSADYQCIFNIWYFAINGTWNCTGVARNSYSVYNATDSSNVSQLYALNISNTAIDYANLQPNEFSPNVSVDVTNVGNMPMNISVYGFGGENETNGTGLSMVCEINNITVSFEKFSTNNTADYASKKPLSSTPQDIGLTIPAKTAYGDLTTNTTYWQLMVPPQNHSFGQCNGSVVFMSNPP